jgi:hypothetical protein
MFKELKERRSGFPHSVYAKKGETLKNTNVFFRGRGNVNYSQIFPSRGGVLEPNPCEKQE